MRSSVEELLIQHEGKTLEFKAYLDSPVPFLKSVVAFANTAGGTLLFGVKDRSREVLGIDDPLDLEMRIANLISDSIRPRLLPEIEILPWRRTNLVAVQVFPSPFAPHYVKNIGPEQGAFIRVGSTNRVADRAIQEEMRRMASNQSYDEEPIPDLNSEVIDFRAASELFKPNRQLSQRDLEVLGLVKRSGNRKVPTVGGVLLFGKTRSERFPDAFLQAGRFAGKDRTRILDSMDIHTHLPGLVEESITFIRKHESVGLQINSARHQELWPVPLPAIREAVINAIVHADYAQRGAPIRLAIYDDRIEVENPGLLPFGLTVEDIIAGVSKLRNRVIGRVFKELGLIEQWGSGIGRMMAACREAGLPSPRFEELGRHFRVTLYKSASLMPQADAIETKILAFLADGRGYTTAEVAKKIGRSSRATRARLAAMVEQGIVREVGTGPQDPKRKYYLSKQER